MPQVLAATQFIALMTAYHRYSALENRVNPPTFLPPLKGYDNYPNEAIDLNQLFDLGTLLDRQTFQAPWPRLPDAIFAELDQWVGSCGLYDNVLCRWKELLPGLPLDLIVSVYRRIIDAFHNSFYNTRADTTSICTTASFAPPACRHAFKSMPSLAICGTRRSFGVPDIVDLGIDSGSLFHASPIEVVLEKDVVEGHEVLQLAAYARQYFIKQPTRHTVRCLLLTENNFRMYVFDSNGLLYLDAMNVHERPVEFLWSVLQLSLSGTWTAYDFDYDMICQYGRPCFLIPSFHLDPLEIVNNAPIYTSEEFLGRRTVCWKLRISDGRTVIIKNSSVYHDPTANMFLEWQFLELARGIPGVGEVFSHAERDIICCSDRWWTPRNLIDPVFPMQYNMRCTFVMQYYERSILDFDNRTELLCVLRDAIETHKNLWMKGIWHDDIRPDNIRIPTSGSEDGHRAVLIGFARAKLVDPMAGNDVIFNWDYAGRDKDTFKSRYRPTRMTPWFGYLHDLESFLLVLASTCSLFFQPHLPIVPYPDLRKPVPGWDSPDYLYSRGLKSCFLSQVVECDGNGDNFVAMGYFGQVFVDLIAAWTVWLDAAYPEVQEKGEMKVAQTEGHYSDVLDMIDTAIRRVEEEEEKEMISNVPDPLATYFTFT